MTVNLSPELQKLVEQNMKRGGYATPEAALLAGMVSLTQQIELGEFDTGEMESLLAEGEASGEFLEGREVLDELRALRQQRGNAAR
jgi:hypothetical protein